MAPFLASLRPRSLPRTKHHIPAQCKEDDQAIISLYQRPRSQIQDQSASSSFLPNLRPRSPFNNSNSNETDTFPTPRSHNNPNDISEERALHRSHNSNHIFDHEGAAAFSANFRPRSHSSQEGTNSNSKTYSNSNSQETSFSRLNLWARSKKPSAPNLPARSSRPKSKSQESNSTSSSRPRSSQTNSQESCSSTNMRPRSRASCQDKSSSRLRARSPHESQEFSDRPRSPANIPFLSNLRTRARSTLLEDQMAEETAKPRFATDMPGCARGADLPRRRSRRSLRRSKNTHAESGSGAGTDNGNINGNRKNSTDSSQIHRAHLDRLQLNAADVLKRAIKRVYVKNTILNSLKELDALVHYAELDLRTIPVVSKRILGIQSVNNIVVEKQLQAAAYMYSLRKKPENEAVKHARNVMNSASCLLDDKENDYTNGSTAQVDRLSKMERALCVSANDLGEVSQKSCSVREQVLELLVLTTRKRAEIEIKAALAASISISKTSGIVESDESFTSEEEEVDRTTKDVAEKELFEKENGSPKCVRDSIIEEQAVFAGVDNNNNIGTWVDRAACATTTTTLPSAEDRRNAAVLISRSWKLKKLTMSQALAYLVRLRTIEREITMGNCGSLHIFDELAAEARIVRDNICNINDPDLRRIGSSKDGSEWDRTLCTGRRNAAISTVIRAISQWSIRRECVRESLYMIETVVSSATRSDTEAGYENSLERLANIDELRRQVVRRKVISGRNTLLQKQRQLRRSSARISELRQLSKQAELTSLEKAAAESRADDYVNWWTDFGKHGGQLGVLLATLDRILPEWNYDSNGNMDLKKMYRKALLLVHPDRLAKAKKCDPFDQVLAQKIFVELQQAYDIFVEHEKKIQALTYCATNFG